MLYLNLGALGTFSPLNILSAPTFLPFEGQPYFGPNTLLYKLQEPRVLQRMHSTTKKRMVLLVFIGFGLTF